MKKNGFKCRKMGVVPAKANPSEQSDFVSKVLDPAVNMTKEGKAKLFFMDATRLIHGGSFIGRVWSKTRIFVEAACGRSRHNVLGAFDFVTKHMVTVTNTTYITATQVVELFGKLIEANPGLVIYIVLDNARCQKCKLINEFTKNNPMIELLYLPPYSPNLNVIERVWKFLKGRLADAAYIETFSEFQAIINGVLNNLGSEYLDQMTSLTTANVQTFKDVRILGATKAA
jgi:transposase